MDNTTPQQNNQGNMTTEDLRAALGFSTNLMSQMLPKDEMIPTDGPQEAPNGTGQEMGTETKKEPQEDKMMAMEGKMDEKMEILRTEMKSVIKTEIESIRDDIKTALENEQT